MSSAAVAVRDSTPPGSNTLGILAKSAAGQSNQRVTLLRAAQRLLFDPESGPHQQARTVWCGRIVLGESVRVLRSVDGSGARTGGLHTCGSVWACPVCSRKVSEVRRAELLAGMATWRAASDLNRVQLLTLTFPHDAGQALPDLLERFGLALRKFKAGAVWRKFSAEHSRAGSVRSLEVTHGANGWHPHSHELVFLRALPSDWWRAELAAAWLRCLKAAGLDGAADAHILEHGLDLRGGDYAAEYVSKFGRDLEGWSVADELTRGHSKIGARSAGAVSRAALDVHVTPFQLLAWWQAGDVEAGALFREYARAFEGKRMLFWSPKLRQVLGVADLDDAEIAARLGRTEPLPDESPVGSLTPQQWAVIVSRGAQCDLLELAAMLDDPCAEHRQACLDEFVTLQTGKVPLHSRRVRYRPWRSSSLYDL